MVVIALKWPNDTTSPEPEDVCNEFTKTNKNSMKFHKIDLNCSAWNENITNKDGIKGVYFNF